MRRLLALVVIAALAVALLAGCSTGDGTVELVTIGEGVDTEGRPVFYEFYTDG